MDENKTPQPMTRAARRERRRDYRLGLQRVMALFLVIVLAAVNIANLMTPERTFSRNENRMLSLRPEFSWQSLWDGSYMEGLESWQADQFFARDGWISLKLRLDRLLGRRESNGVYLGEEDYLMEIPADPDMESVERNLNAIAAFAGRYPGLDMQMLVSPNAVCVLEEYLPENAPVRDQSEDIAYIRSRLPESVSFIDVTEALRAHGQDGVFYRTDHHWTSLGAYYAFLAAADELGIEGIRSYIPHVVSTTFEGTLASKSGSHAVTDTVEVYEPVEPGSEFYVTYDATLEKSRSLFVSECLEEKDQYTLFFGGNHPRITIRTTAGNDRVLLIFKDSYANCFVQFLTPYYETIILIDPRYYYGDAGALIEDEQVTEVLFLYNLSTYLGDTALADTLDTAVPSPAEGEEPLPGEETE